MTQNDPNPSQWREELKNLGKTYFEIQDMMRMGFLELSPDEMEHMKTKLKELNQISGELRKLKKELEGVEDITPIIQEIRKNRIERVRAQRAIRKAEKAKQKALQQAEIKERKKSRPSFLGEKIAQGLVFEGGDEEKLHALQLPVIHDLAALAVQSQLSREDLLWLCYHRQVATVDHYTRFQIPKRKGGTRAIASPKPKLRQAQGWILEQILQKISVHEAAAAFLTGKSIVNNAERHLHKNLLLRIDLKNFFPSIKFYRVKGLFQSFGYNPGMATVLALICTDAARIGAKLGDQKYFVALGERYLPQGACTSPTLSNIICRSLDHRLYKLAQSMNWTYSRYADDLVFSHENSQAELKSLLGLSRKIIAEESFIINEDKTMVMRPHQRQSVTGIVVNDGEMRISRRDMRRFRAFLHQYEQEGAEKMNQKLGKDATQYGKGYWAFIQMVNPTQAKKFSEKYPWLRTQ